MPPPRLARTLALLGVLLAGAGCDLEPINPAEGGAGGAGAGPAGGEGAGGAAAGEGGGGPVPWQRDLPPGFPVSRSKAT